MSFYQGKPVQSADNSHKVAEVRDDPVWQVDDAPASYVDMLSKGIIGIQIEVTKLEGRLKLSQDKSKGDREGVAAGLSAFGQPEATMLAAEVQEQSDLKTALGK